MTIKHKHQTTLPNDEYKDVSANAWNDAHVDENGNDISITPVDKTYAELSAMAAAGTLVPGQLYRMTDFRTRHTIPNTTDINESAVEVLIVMAALNNKLKATAVSETHPDDLIHYELVNTTSDSACDRGRIFYRKDTKRNIELYYDWRSVKFRRWKETFMIGGGPQDFYTAYTDNLSGDYIDVFTFNDPDSTYMRDVSIKPFQNGVLNNIVFHENDVTGVYLEIDCRDTTFCAYVDDCVIGYQGQGDRFLGNIYGCDLGPEFQQNVCYQQLYAVYCKQYVSQNTFRGQLYDVNIESEDFRGNDFADAKTQKIFSLGFSNFGVDVSITGLTTLDITEANYYAGIINATSTNATENINLILNLPSRFDVELIPESDLTLTLTGTAYAAVNADGQILLGAATRVLDGAKRDSIKLRSESITNGNGTFTVAREVGMNISL